MSDNNNINTNLNQNSEPQIPQQPVQVPQELVQAVPVANVTPAPLSAKEQKAAEKQAAKNKKEAEKQAILDRKEAEKDARKAKKKADKKERKKQKTIAKMKAKKAKRKNKTAGQIIVGLIIKLVLLLLLAVVLAAGITMALACFNLVEFPFVNGIFEKYNIKKYKEDSKVKIEATVDDESEDETIEETIPEAIDAESYFEENSSSNDVIDAATSSDVTDEGDTIELLTDRGFEEYDVVGYYNMDGEFSQSVANSYSSDTHPMYETAYISSANELWSIVVINGSVMAIPLSYEAESTLGIEVIISETNTLTSYDSATNSFYETIPNEDVVKVIVVDHIDAATLDGLTVSEITSRVG